MTILCTGNARSATDPLHHARIVVTCGWCGRNVRCAMPSTDSMPFCQEITRQAVPLRSVALLHSMTPSMGRAGTMDVGGDQEEEEEEEEGKDGGAGAGAGAGAGGAGRGKEESVGLTSHFRKAKDSSGISLRTCEAKSVTD
eukprot:323858-Rhodomonas_salina.5